MQINDMLHQGEAGSQKVLDRKVLHGLLLYADYLIWNAA